MSLNPMGRRSRHREEKKKDSTSVVISEIGSEFALANSLRILQAGRVPAALAGWPNMVLTSSGRGAIRLVLAALEGKALRRSALLPAYCCQSMVDPFITSGFQVSFYDIQKQDLLPDMLRLEKMASRPVGIFLYMGYFGFPADDRLKEIIRKVKRMGAMVIEDVTHTLFSVFDREPGNDFFVASLRKWIGIPSGGMLSSCKPLTKTGELKPDPVFPSIRLAALQKKAEFMRTGNGRFKLEFLELFRTAEAALDGNPNAYAIDDLSASILNGLQADKIWAARRRNYFFLADAMRENPRVQVIFPHLSAGVCPVFLPLYIRGRREPLRQNLTRRQVYLPVHWPKPAQVDLRENPGTQSILSEIISIPIDQRYGQVEMQRIADLICGSD